MRGYEFYTQDAVSGPGRVEDIGDGPIQYLGSPVKGSFGWVMGIVGEKSFVRPQWARREEGAEKGAGRRGESVA